MMNRRRIRKRSSGRFAFIFGGSLTGLLLFCALFGPWMAPFAPDEYDESALLSAPSEDHWLGTDEDGGDLLSQLILGARVAAIVGVATVTLSVLIGLSVGLIAGTFGGWLDESLMRLAEVVLSFPGILLAILIQAILPRPGLTSVVLALSLTGWAGYARLVRGQVLQIRERDFIKAVIGLGAGPGRLMVRHLLPNVLAPVLVQATFGVAGAILAEASLSFLGLGPQGQPSWGAMLDQGAVLFTKSPTVALWSGLAILVTVLALNLLGDALRDRLDPHH